VNGPHAHDEPVEPRAEGPGPWGWPCPECGTENLMREDPTGSPSTVHELRCDYCGTVTELTFGA
jgi:predicted RNA-binding Zn-ribbon protein involved in translation (DUF1610 family)